METLTILFFALIIQYTNTIIYKVCLQGSPIPVGVLVPVPAPVPVPVPVPKSVEGDEEEEAVDPDNFYATVLGMGSRKKKFFF